MAVKSDSLKLLKNCKEPMNSLHFTQPKSPVSFFPRVSELSITQWNFWNLTSIICSLQPSPTNTNQNNLDLKTIPTTSLLFTGYITAFQTRGIQNLADSTLQDFLFLNISCAITTTTFSKFKLLLPTWKRTQELTPTLWPTKDTSLRLAFSRKCFKAINISAWFFHVSGHRLQGTLPT